MFKHISAINRHPGQSVEEFRKYWETVHSQLVKGMLPKLRKYVANFPIRDQDVTWPGSGQRLQCDAIVELHFDTLSDLLEAMASEGWLSEDRMASSAKLMDLKRNLFLVAEEVEVELPSQQ